MSAIWEAFETDKEWKMYLQNLVKTNERALLKAIVLIYDNQTPEEQQSGESIEDNDIGFTKYDAKELGDIAKKIKVGEQLTAGELAKSKNKMTKYWKQLMVISKRQIVEKAEQERIKRLQCEKQYFEHSIEVMRKCSEEGIACEYGICDECPVMQGLQMRFNFDSVDTEEDNE